MNASTKKEFSISIDGHTYQVKVEELAGGELEVELDGSIHRISMVDTAGQEQPTPVPKTAKRAVPTPVLASTPPSRSVMSGTQEMSAPMPGDIVQIMVNIGDQVSVGQEICVLEAMKMKNILRSSNAGVVKSIEVSIGQSVNYGDVLVRFDS